MEKEEKASDFLNKYIKETKEGKKYIDAVAAISELYARMKANSSSIREINKALGYFTSLEERVNKLEGNKKIEIVSEEEGKKLLK